MPLRKGRGLLRCCIRSGGVRDDKNDQRGTPLRNIDFRHIIGREQRASAPQSGSRHHEGGYCGGVGVGGYFVWNNFVALPKIPRSVVALSGRIEGDDSAVAPKTAGRILEIRFREGDSVKAGDTIAVLDDAQVFAREEQARAAVTVAEARTKSARDQIAVLQEQLQQNDLQTEQSKVDASGRVRQAEADVAAAEADLASQEASFQIADFDRTAYNKLRRPAPPQNARPSRPTRRRNSRKRRWPRQGADWNRRGAC